MQYCRVLNPQILKNTTKPDKKKKNIKKMKAKAAC